MYANLIQQQFFGSNRHKPVDIRHRSTIYRPVRLKKNPSNDDKSIQALLFSTVECVYIVLSPNNNDIHVNNISYNTLKSPFFEIILQRVGIYIAHDIVALCNRAEFLYRNCICTA